MIQTSEAYQQKIYDDETKTYCTISYNSVDVTARGLVNASASSTMPWTVPANTVDEVITTQKYATGEQNEWVLDKSIELFQTENRDWGWWSGELSNEEGTFTTNPIITYSWGENHTSVGLTLSFLEPIFEATIRWYDSSNTLIDAYNFTNDDISLIEYIVENGVENYQKIQIEFVRILPYHYVKMEDIAFGVKYIWKDEIINIDVVEQMDNKSQELSSSQATIKLNNIDNSFNKYNPEGKLQYLQEGQQIQVDNIAVINGQEEKLPLGTFYLTTWNNPTEFTTQLIANDLIYKLSNRTYTHSLMYANATASTIIDDLFTQFNLSYEGKAQYIIDANVASVQLSGYIPICDYREALQHICIALGAVAYCDRQGKIVIKRLESTSPVVDIGYDKKAYAGDNEDEKYTSVAVKKYTFAVSSETTTLFSGVVTGDTTITFDSPYSNITITGTHTSHEIYANCVEIHGASGTINITGKVYNTYEQNVIAEIPDTMVGITKQRMELDNIYLISTQETAEYVASWLLGELQKYITNEFKWLGNPSIEVTDRATVQVAENIERDATIIKNMFNYNGALWETTEVVM